MKEKECDIIKDLLPSYVDEICSETSKLWIEEHMAECEECRKKAELLKNTEVSAMRLEQKGFDAAKKIVLQNQRRSILGLTLCFLLTMLVMYLLYYDYRYGQVPLQVLYIALPVCMAISWLVCRNQKKERNRDKWDKLSMAVILVTAAYGMGIMVLGMNCVMKHTNLLGLRAERVGPFMDNQFLLCMVIGFLLYLIQIGRSMKQGRTGSMLPNLSLMVALLMANYRLHLGVITSFEAAVTSLTRSTLWILGIGGVMTVLLFVLDKRGNENKLFLIS